jgi:RNA polymerase sigma-70 factor (ECF subfamily)
MSHRPNNPADHEQMESLFREHHRTVLGFAMRRTAEPADAADVVAEVFLTTWRRLEDVPPGDAARPWLLGTARRVLANQRRGERRRDGLAERLRMELEAHTPFHEPDIAPPAIRRALARLTERDREILQLAAWEELSPAEIAVVLDVGSTTARSRLRRARKRFEKQLAASGWAAPHEFKQPAAEPVEGISK